MAILAGFKNVKTGVSYNGVMVDYILVDTKRRFHLMPFTKSILDTPRPIAVIDSTIEFTPNITAEDRANIFWLWESLEAS